MPCFLLTLVKLFQMKAYFKFECFFAPPPAKSDQLLELASLSLLESF